MFLPFSVDIYISVRLESPYSTDNQLDNGNLKDDYLYLRLGLCVQNVCWKGDIIYNNILVISILRIRYNREHTPAFHPYMSGFYPNTPAFKKETNENYL